MAYNLKEIMTNAWNIYNSEEITFSEALTASWAQSKVLTKDELINLLNGMTESKVWDYYFLKASDNRAYSKTVDYGTSEYYIETKDGLVAIGREGNRNNYNAKGFAYYSLEAAARKERKEYYEAIKAENFAKAIAKSEEAKETFDVEEAATKTIWGKNIFSIDVIGNTYKVTLATKAGKASKKTYSFNNVAKLAGLIK